jgi:excisionase family DNA binding protein
VIQRVAGVLLDADEATYLCHALDLLAQLMAEQRDVHGQPTPSQPTPRLVATTAKLRRTVASLALRDPAPDDGRCPEPPAQTASLRAPQRDSVDAGPHDLGTGEAARIIGCTPGNVRDLARRGRLAATDTGTRWRFDSAAVTDYAARRAASKRE